MPVSLTLLRDALAVNPKGFAPLRGLRAAVGMALVLGIGVGTGNVAPGVFASIGALTAGTVAFTTGSRTPLGTMTGAGIAIAVSTTVGGLTAHSLTAELLALAVWGAAAGLASAAGQAATTIGVQAVVGLVVLGRFPLTLHAALAAAGEVMLGAMVQVLLAAIVRTPTRERVERLALSEIALALADWARTGGRPASGQIADQVTALRTVLDRRAGVDGEAPLRSLLTGLSRARLEVSVLTLQRDRARPGVDGEELNGVLVAAAQDLQALAAEVRAGRPSAQAGDSHLAGSLSDRDDLVSHRARALAGQLRAAHLSLAAWAQQRPRAGQLVKGRLRTRGGVRGFLDALRHPTPSARRHAIRLALLLPLSEALARVLPLERGYWVALTAVIVLKPDFATSAQRGIGRVLGTLGGVVPVSLFVGLLHPRGGVLVVLVGVLAWVAFTSFSAGFALFSGALAGLVVALLDVVTPGGTAVAGARAIDTLIGGALALLTYLVFPSWEGPLLSESVARLVEAQDAYAGLVLASIATGPDARAELGAGASAVRVASAALQAALAKAEVEPKLLVGASGVLGLRMARDTLAANSRIVASLHVLHTHAVGEHPATEAVSDLAPLRAALHSVLGDTARAVREHQPFDDSVDLRAVAAPTIDHQSSALAPELDEIVDAVDTLRFALADRVVHAP